MVNVCNDGDVSNIHILNFKRAAKVRYYSRGSKRKGLFNTPLKAFKRRFNVVLSKSFYEIPSMDWYCPITPDYSLFRRSQTGQSQLHYTTARFACSTGFFGEICHYL